MTGWVKKVVMVAVVAVVAVFGVAGVGGEPQRKQYGMVDNGSGLDVLQPPYSTGEFGWDVSREAFLRRWREKRRRVRQATAVDSTASTDAAAADDDGESADRPYEVFYPPPRPTPSGDGDTMQPFVRLQRQAKRGVGIRVATAIDPLRTVSIYEPGDRGSCSSSHTNRTLTSVTARRFGCKFAANAGYFNTKTGECYGDIISDGREVKLPSRRNAHFGIRQDGSIEVGYLEDLYGVISANSNQTMPNAHASRSPLVQLISGALWLVRNGKNYVADSMLAEDMNIQETGSWSYFASVESARTAIGHTRDGAVVVVQHDGKTGRAGTDLYEFADHLISLGVVNAINLDGGGSSVSVVNGTVTSTTSDTCSYDRCHCMGNETVCGPICSQYSCERRVTTIICMHEPRWYNDTEACLSSVDCDSAELCINGTCWRTTAASALSPSGSVFGLPCEAQTVGTLLAVLVAIAALSLVANGVFLWHRSGYTALHNSSRTRNVNLDPLMSALSWIPTDDDDDDDEDGDEDEHNGGDMGGGGGATLSSQQRLFALREATF